MGPKKGKRVREIEASTHSVPGFELGDTVVDIQQRREEREARQREEAQQQREEQARLKVAEKRTRTEKCDTETEAGGEVGPSQSGYKMGHMTNIYLTDSDEEAIVD